MATKTTPKLYVRCDHCPAVHEATYSHEGSYGEGAVYEVTCTVDLLADYYLAERLTDARGRSL